MAPSENNHGLVRFMRVLGLIVLLLMLIGGRVGASSDAPVMVLSLASLTCELTYIDGRYSAADCELPLAAEPGQVIWLGITPAAAPDSWFKLYPLPWATHPPQLDRRGRYFGCVGLTVDYTCGVHIEYGRAVYVVDVPVALKVPTGGDVRALAQQNPNITTLEIPAVGIQSVITQFPLRGPTWAINPWERRIGHFEYTDWFGAGNTVLGGHSELPDRTPGIFSALYDVAVGDEIIVTVEGEPIRYVVQTIYVVHYQDLSPVRRSPANTLTLITCDIPSRDDETGRFEDRLVVVAGRG